MLSLIKVLEANMKLEKDEEEDNDDVEEEEEDRFSAYELCGICGDRMTGKHYGANACDGCKGFFRRSVRKNTEYICMSLRNCIITKERRNQCRYCRLKKCFKAGMKREAVQSERDRIVFKKSAVKTNDFSAMNFIEAELHADLVEENVTFKESKVPKSYIFSRRKMATIHEVTEVLKEYFLRLIKWAKLIPEFVKLSLDDQVALLRGHAGDHFILWIARHSLDFSNVLILGKDFFIPPDESEFDQSKIDVRHIANRICNGVVKTLNNIEVDKIEFSLLQAVSFFDPYLRGLKNKDTVKSVRSQLLSNLETYMRGKEYGEGKGRFGELLLLLPELQAVKLELVEQLTLANLCGTVEIETFLQDMLHGGNMDSMRIETIETELIPMEDMKMDAVVCSPDSGVGAGSSLSPPSGLNQSFAVDMEEKKTLQSLLQLIPNEELAKSEQKPQT